MRFYCEYPDHEGSRFVASPLDRFTQRVTYMRVDGKQRLHERSTLRLCRDCVELVARKDAADQLSIL